ncbi:MAG TPA: hypothetical protein VFE36_16705 [Candidatus Baltobacteraceae bacterium]|jgi:hypothetical protein|nr:hypothetical protein [Candidatus Baltobacteraceae bacterium]
MNRFGIVSLVAAFLVLSGQTHASPKHLLHLVYRFGYNTPAANSGKGTGTTTIDVMGPASDGGLIVSGTDFWWNTVRARATNTCEVYKDGTVACNTAPYALSPMQLTIFPLLAKSYFKDVSSGGPTNWTQTFTVKAVVAPGATGFAGQLYTWKCSFNVTNKGQIPKGDPLVLVTTNGSLVQGFFRATSKQRIAYDPVNKVPAVVSDVRTHVPQRSSESFDTIEVKLQKLRHG